MKHTCAILLISVIATHQASAQEEEQEILIKAERLDAQEQVLDEDALRALPGMSLAEAVEELPGVDVLRSAQGAPEPYLRGLGGERVRTQVGALPLFGACPARMDPPLVYLLPQTSGALRLNLGSDGADAGPAAMGGRIRLRPDWEPGPDWIGPFAADASIGFASDGLRSRLGAGAAGVMGGFEGRLAVDLGMGGDYRSGGGLTVPGKHEHLGASASLAYRMDEDQRFFVALSHVRESDVDHPALPMNNDLTDFWMAHLGYRLQGGGLFRALEWQAGLAMVDHEMSNRDKPSSRVLDAVTPSTALSAATALGLHLAPLPALRVRTGLDFYFLRRDARRSRTVLASGQTFFDHLWPQADEWNAGLYAQGTWTFAERWMLMADGRLDLNGAGAGALDEPSLQGMSIAEQFQAFYGPDAAPDSVLALLGSARLQLAVLPTPGLQVYAELSWAARAPSLTERYFAFAPAPGGYQLGRPDLAAEKKSALEAGLRFRSAWLDADAALFGYRVDDFILRRLAERNDVNGDGMADKIYSFAGVLAWLAGGELGLRLKANEWLSLPLGAQAVYGWNETEGVPLAEIPALSGHVGLRAENRAGALPWWAEFTSRLTAAQTRVDASLGETASDPYTVLSVRAGIRPWPWLHIAAGVENLTDEDYSPYLNKTVPMQAGDLAPGMRIPAPGLSGWLTLRGRY